MEILTDLHVHSIASDHAYSTILENVHYAKEKGLEAMAVTEHAAALGDAPHIFFFNGINGIPDYIEGVRVLKGVEANILNRNGDLDMPDKLLKTLDIVIASIHSICFESDDDIPGDIKDYNDVTSAYMKVLDNPYVDIIGHSGSPKFPYNIERVVRRAKKLGKLIEINAGSYDHRPKNISLCREIALMCKKIGTGVCVNSDAHICFKIGDYDSPLEMLRGIEFPEELIINRNLDTLRAFFAKRNKIIK